MLHFADTFLIRSLLLQFTPSVAGGQWGITVALGIRIEHLDIKQRLLLSITPKPSCLYVSSGLISVYCTICGQLFSRQRLQHWLQYTL